MKNILITGITGQDGIFLTRLLKNKSPNCNIVGTSRNSNNNIFFQKLNYLKLEDTRNINIFNIDLNNFNEVNNFVREINPDFVYNFSGPSSVYESLENSYIQTEINNGFKNLTESLIVNKNFCNFFQASSSEMFADSDKQLDENSKFEPNSPYAKAKLDIHYKVLELNEKFDWKIISGIMFNHESEFRSDNFLFYKIINAAVEIKNKKRNSIELGNLDIERDWSYAKEIVEGVYETMNYGSSPTYVYGSGKSTSIKNCVDYIFKAYDLDWREFVKTNKSFIRDNDPLKKICDPTRIYNEIGWETKTSIFEVLNLMINYKSRLS